MNNLQIEYQTLPSTSLGRFIPEPCKIIINKDLSKEDQQYTLFHEICHYISYKQYNTLPDCILAKKIEECICDEFASQLLGINISSRFPRISDEYKDIIIEEVNKRKGLYYDKFYKEFI